MFLRVPSQAQCNSVYMLTELTNILYFKCILYNSLFDILKLEKMILYLYFVQHKEWIGRTIIGSHLFQSLSDGMSCLTVTEML